MRSLVMARCCRPRSSQLFVVVMQLLVQPPLALAEVTYSSSFPDSWGRSRYMWLVLRSTGVVPENLQRGLISSVGFSNAWDPKSGSVETLCCPQSAAA